MRKSIFGKALHVKILVLNCGLDMMQEELIVWIWLSLTSCVTLGKLSYPFNPHFLTFKMGIFLPWLVWLSGLSVDLRTERLLVRFPFRVHTWVVGQVTCWGMQEAPVDAH